MTAPMQWINKAMPMAAERRSHSEFCRSARGGRDAMPEGKVGFLSAILTTFRVRLLESNCNPANESDGV